MSFIAKSPLSAAKLDTAPPSLSEGNRGIFPTEDGWFDIDDTGKVNRILTNEDFTNELKQRLQNNTFDGYYSFEAADGNIPGAFFDEIKESGIYKTDICYMPDSDGSIDSGILFVRVDEPSGAVDQMYFDNSRIILRAYDWETEEWTEWTSILSDVRKSITAVGTNLNKHISESEMLKNKGIANGYAPLDYNGLVPSKHLNNAVPHTTASGYPISLTDHLEGESVIDYKVYGNSVQDGSPSADSPIEIQSVGDLVTDTSSENYGKYDVPVTVCGKNLIDIQKNVIKNGTIQEVTGLNSGDYCFSFKTYNNTSTVGARIYVYDTDGKGSYLSVTPISSSSPGGGIAACNFSYDKDTYPRIFIACYIQDTNVSADSFMITSGTYSLNNIPEYEPYQAPITKHIYLNEPLRKKGDYADYIDYKNQSVVRQIEVLDSTGTKTIDESLGLLETQTTENITIPDLTVPYSGVTNVFVGTTTKPSSIDVSYYQDINKVISELKNAILAQGGNV